MTVRQSTAIGNEARTMISCCNVQNNDWIIFGDQQVVVKQNNEMSRLIASHQDAVHVVPHTLIITPRAPCTRSRLMCVLNLSISCLASMSHAVESDSLLVRVDRYCGLEHMRFATLLTLYLHGELSFDIYAKIQTACVASACCS